MTDIAKTIKAGERITVRGPKIDGKSYTSLPRIDLKAGDRAILSDGGTEPPPPGPEPEPQPTPEPEPEPTPEPEPEPTPGHDHDCGPDCDHGSFAERVPAGWVHIRTDAHWRDTSGGHPLRRHLHFDQAYPPPNQPQSGVVKIPSRFTAFFQVGTFDRAKYQTQETDGKVIFFRVPMVDGVPIDWDMPVDTTKEPDMLGLLRNYEFVEHPEGNEQSCRPRVPMLFSNGNPKKSPSGGTDYWGVTTWYKVAANPGVKEVDMGYLHAGLAVKSWPGQWHKVGNQWDIDVEFVHNDKGGAPPMSRWFVAADIDYHNVEAGEGQDPVDIDPYGGGVLLASGNGPKKGTISLNLSALTPGKHTLVLCNVQEDGAREARAFGFFDFTKV